MKLVIVESPAKAKTIGKYLGKGYDVVASNGHIRDLQKSTLSVDIENDFTPKYVEIRGKSKLIKELKSAAAASDKVYLATDPDREGEAISWHLAYLLGLDTGDKNRVTFNEITKSGVTGGMASPRNIDLDLVNAQQARRVLDRLVGYKLSPFISQKIRRGLSAGRVQSVAVRLIVDREDEINAFIPEEYWSIVASLLAPNAKNPFDAQFYGDKKGKISLTNKEDTDNVLAGIDGASYIIDDIKKGQRKKNPSPPFITSTMQQEASRKLNFNARRTMKAAQELYEGVNIKGQGLVGLITYMRTDSLRVSNEALADAGDFILSRYGAKYKPEKPNFYKSKANSQDGHEAIRPTMPALTPLEVKESLTDDQFRLYKLVWERFIASQMTPCIQNTTTLTIGANDYIFKASGYTVQFDGFTVLYTEGRDTKDTENKLELPIVNKGDSLELKDLKGDQHFTEPPARYTEASLIKALEENGIGRPSTYAATISTITAREYVLREGKALKPTELGAVVTSLMKERFDKIVDVKFTAGMENNLDGVETGKSDWVETVREFYTDFEKTLNTAKEEMDGVKLKLTEEDTGLICPNCGKPMIVKYGRFGRFVACSGYPECKTIHKEVDDTKVVCPKCSTSTIHRKKSRKGKIFYSCSGYPNCDFISWDEPTEEMCTVCGKPLFKKAKGDIYCPTCNPPEIKEYKKTAAKKTAKTKAGAKKTTTAKKPAAKKTTVAKKTTTAKKPAVKKAASKENDG